MGHFFTTFELKSRDIAYIPYCHTFPRSSWDTGNNSEDDCVYIMVPRNNARAEAIRANAIRTGGIP